MQDWSLKISSSKYRKDTMVMHSQYAIKTQHKPNNLLHDTFLISNNHSRLNFLHSHTFYFLLSLLIKNCIAMYN